MNILGISAYSHNRAVCLVQNGEIVAAVGEEQPAPKGKDFVFLVESIADCLQQAGIDVDELAYIVFDCKPLVTFERILKTYLTTAPAGFRSFLKEIPPWIQYGFRIGRDLVQEIGFHGKVIFPERHEVLAASAFYPSPFHEAAFLIIDGVGEWTTTSYGNGTEEGISVLAEMRFPHSLGLLYSAFTGYLGFQMNSGEKRLVEAASDGAPKYKRLMLSTLMDLKEDGSFRLDMAYFDYCAGVLVTNAKFAELFDRPARTAETPLTAMDMDIACSVLAAIEEIILRMVEHVYRQTGQKKLCLVGEVFRSGLAGEDRLQESSFDEIWIQPAVAGTDAALGAALFVRNQQSGYPWASRQQQVENHT